MRKLFVSAFVLAAVLMLATSGLALEKSARVFNGDELGDWNAQTTCSVTYYNICTGWIWIWSGFADGDLLGTVYQSCGGGVDGVYLYYWTGAISGYGFTGTHALYAVDGNDCPTGGAIATTPWLPASGWNLTLFGGVSVPAEFAFVATLQDNSGFSTPVALPSDGANSFGICFPTTRVANSYFWGLETSPICPGSKVIDSGGGQCEWLTKALMVGPVSVEDQSWGSIKDLYR